MEMTGDESTWTQTSLKFPGPGKDESWYQFYPASSKKKSSFSPGINTIDGEVNACNGQLFRDQASLSW